MYIFFEIKISGLSLKSSEVRLLLLTHQFHLLQKARYFVQNEEKKLARIYNMTMIHKMFVKEGRQKCRFSLFWHLRFRDLAEKPNSKSCCDEKSQRRKGDGHDDQRIQALASCSAS